MADPAEAEDEPEPGPERKILHVDMDAFFASVEVLDDPSLAGRPVIVGGSGRRGVVAACTYEARMFGVHSAMPSAVARRLCPEAVFVEGRFHRYVEESRKLHAILGAVTPLVEGISLDEAFLDVTGAEGLFGSAEAIAHAIRSRVAEELRLHCSVGGGRSKLIAKLASKAAKPTAASEGITAGYGVLVIPVADELSFLWLLPHRALWGVGPVTGARLEALGVTTVGDIAALPAGLLRRTLGEALGSHLEALAHGHDPRPVVPEQAAKSVGHEETFSHDLWDRDELHVHLVRMADASAGHLRASGTRAGTVTVKVRFADFSTITRSHTLGSPIDTAPAVATVAGALLDGVAIDQGVRLLGVSLSGFGCIERGIQLTLDLDGGSDVVPPEGATGATDAEADRIQQSWGAVTAAVDAIRARYGGASVGPTSLVDGSGLRVRRRGDAQWGPAVGGGGSVEPSSPTGANL